MSEINGVIRKKISTTILDFTTDLDSIQDYLSFNEYQLCKKIQNFLSNQNVMALFSPRKNSVKCYIISNNHKIDLDKRIFYMRGIFYQFQHYIYSIILDKTGFSFKIKYDLFNYDFVPNMFCSDDFEIDNKYIHKINSKGKKVLKYNMEIFNRYKLRIRQNF
jgi:hypothetical protein